MHHDPVQLGSAGGEGDQSTNDASEDRWLVGTTDSLDVCGDGVVELGQESFKALPPQLMLRTEVVVDLGLMGPSAGRDGASGSAVVPVRGEFDERSLDQAMSRVGRATIPPVAPGNGGGKASLHNYFSIS